VALAAFAALLAAPAARAQDTSEYRRDSSKVLTAFKTVVKKPSDSTVRVLCDEKQVALGTVVSSDGYIVTKASELRGKIVCEFKGSRTLTARLVGSDEEFDLALLKVSATDLKPVQWVASNTAEAGDWVATPGLGAKPVTVGVVSVAARKVRKGPSGPSSAYMGIQMGELEKDGVQIGKVMPNTGASKAGIKDGDVILSIEGRKVKQYEDVARLLGKYRPGDSVKLKIRRDEEELDKTVTLGKRPALSRSEFQNSLGGDLSSRKTGFPEVLQHDSALKPRDCGGPLVDLDGKAVGVNIARAGRTESYAIPSEAVQRLVKELKAAKK
jgi:serine protease Do